MPGHGAQISAQAPSKHYVQTAGHEHQIWTGPYFSIFKSDHNVKGHFNKQHKWLFRPFIFLPLNELNLYVTLDLTGKHFLVIFAAVLCFFLLLRNNACRNAGFPEPALTANARSADSIVWKNKSFVWKGCHQEKHCIFAYVICGKRKRNQRTKIGGGTFFSEVEGHIQKLS